MPSQEDIKQQQDLLAAHRRTLGRYLGQRADFGSEYAPPSVLNGIDDARAEIQTIKNTLRSWGVAVEDLPDDEKDLLPPVGRSRAADSALKNAWAWWHSLTASERRLWAYWVLANALGWGVVGLVQVVGWLGEWGAPVTWGLVALVQWWVLRYHGLRLPLWPLTGIIGGAVATVLRLGAGGVGGWFVGTVVGWGVGSLAQWALLRRHTSRAPWWAITSIIIGILSWQVSRAALQVVFRGLIAAGMTVSYLISNVVAVAVYWVVAGALYALLTGPILVWLLQASRTTIAPSSSAAHQRSRSS